MNNLEVITPDYSHIPGILSVQNDLLVMNKEDNFESWFLVHPIKTEEIMELLQKDKEEQVVIKVITSWNQVAWYWLMYNVALQAPSRWWNVNFDNDSYQNIFDGNKVGYGRHVAIKPGFIKRWVGSALEQIAIEEAKNKWFVHLIGEIAQEINVRWKKFTNMNSWDYHTKRWFEKIGQVTYWVGENYELRNLMMKKI